MALEELIGGLMFIAVGLYLLIYARKKLKRIFFGILDITFPKKIFIIFEKLAVPLCWIGGIMCITAGILIIFIAFKTRP